MKVLCSIIFALAFYTVFAENEKIVKARVESCPACKLNRLSEVKAFIYDDLPKYENTEFKKIHGASPELLFLDENDQVVEKHSLEPLNREQCNNLLKKKGFTQKIDKEL